MKGHTEGVRAVAFTPDGKALVTAGWDGRVLLWRVGGIKPKTTLQEGPVPVTALALGPGKALAWGCYDGTVTLWDGAEKRQLPKSHRWGVFAAALSPDGTRLATGDGDGVLKVW